MKPSLILHIGTTKTGSTSLQNFLFSNRARLLEKGILFPEAGFRVLEDDKIPTSGHSDLFYRQNLLKDLAKEIEDNSSMAVLISTEIISLIISGQGSRYLPN
jgi:capsular polysaccharide export protein